MNRVEALQAALAGEHAAVYGYGVLGARLPAGPLRLRAQAGFDTHRVRRAALRSMIVTENAEPVASAAGYDLGGPLVSTAQASALAGRIELGCAATYGDLVAASEPTDRLAPAIWLTDAAVRASGWTGTATAFPGLTGRMK